MNWEMYVFDHFILRMIQNIENDLPCKKRRYPQIAAGSAREEPSAECRRSASSIPYAEP